MPIRMTDDPNQPQDDFNDDSGGGNRPNLPGGGGGMGGLLNFLPLLLGLFKGKRIFILLIIAAVGYFLITKSGGCNAVQNIVSNFSQSGYNYDKNEFSKASVYEELDETNSRNALPEAVSLARFAPSRLNQGQQGSCVAWSSAYAAQTIAVAAATGQDPNQIGFSPSYLYNQIRLEGCEGSYIQKAMETMQKNGGLPLSQYPYDDQDCARTPNGQALQAGKQNAIHGFQRLTSGDNINVISVQAVKEHLASDAPVVIGMMVGQSFMQNMMGKELWTPQGIDASQTGMGGHAMCVVGYDDKKFGGAFQIMNSWGTEWGKNGIGWVRYGDFKTYVREAYGIDPLPKTSAVANIPLECNVGLKDNSTGKYIPLKLSGANFFETTSPIAIGTRFKVEIENRKECYIYIFGQETDGTSYTLFPYTAKHSPYCGITGYRLFPKSQSLEADNKGNRDYIAMVVTKTALDYAALNKAISQSTQPTYIAKVNEAIKSMAMQSVKFDATSEGRMHFNASENDNQAVACVVAFDKK